MILFILIPLQFKFTDKREPETNFPRDPSRESLRIQCGAQGAADGDV